MITAWKRGYKAEFKAIQFLQTRQKFHILKHRYKTHDGEVDIIALDQSGKKPILVGIEVKLRQSIKSARISITQKQMHRIQNGILHFLANEKVVFDGIRFDVILISNNNIVYIPNAWNDL